MASRAALLALACCCLLLTRATAQQAARECRIDDLEAAAWQAADQVATGAAPDLAPLVVDLIKPLWTSECQLMPEKAEVQVAEACQSKADPLQFSLLVDVALPCNNGTEEAAIVAGQIVLELTTAAASGSGAGGKAGGQGNPL